MTTTIATLTRNAVAALALAGAGLSLGSAAVIDHTAARSAALHSVARQDSPMQAGSVGVADGGPGGGGRPKNV